MYKKKKGTGGSDGLMPEASPSTPLAPSDISNSTDKVSETSGTAQENGGNNTGTDAMPMVKVNGKMRPDYMTAPVERTSRQDGPDAENGTEEGKLAYNIRQEARREKILFNLGDKYSLSTEEANNGEVFYQNKDGNTTLAIIPDEIFDRIGLNPVPFKLTETMGWHVYDHHAKEAKFNDIGDAIDFILSIINNVDHVRLGRDNSYIFSVENGRDRVGKRAVTIMIDSDTGEFMGIRTSGYETLEKLEKRPLLWERGANAVPEDVATPTISTIASQQGDEDASRTKGQSNVSSTGKVSETSASEQENAGKNEQADDRRGSDGNSAGRESGDLAQTEGLNYQLSDEVDENGHQFVLNSDGNIEFGRIGEETGLTSAPILLSEGVITNPKTNAGYGLLHIEARHGEQIRAAGYGSVLEFIEDVAKNYEVIRKGNDRDGRETYMLQLTDRHNNTLMVELSGDGTYWNINTAGIFKTSYGANRTVVYNRHTTANQPAETNEASLSGEQSGTTPSTRMNAPAQAVDVSEGKVSETSETAQENAGKNETADQSREILSSALYNPDLYGQNKKASQPYRWVVINTKDAEGKNRLVLLEVNETKDNVEVVHWHYLRENALETLKRQTKREGGLILILPSDNTEEAGDLSSRTSGLSSAGKVSETSASEQENAGKNSGGVFKKGYGNNKKEVWSASEAQNKQSATDNTLWETDKSDSPETPNGNVSNSSTGKVSETSETAQENARKKWEVAIPI